MSEKPDLNSEATATSQTYAQQEVRIDSPRRTQWYGKLGRAIKFDHRDGMPYIVRCEIGSRAHRATGRESA